MQKKIEKNFFLEFDLGVRVGSVVGSHAACLVEACLGAKTHDGRWTRPSQAKNKRRRVHPPPNMF